MFDSSKLENLQIFQHRTKLKEASFVQFNFKAFRFEPVSDLELYVGDLSKMFSVQLSCRFANHGAVIIGTYDWVTSV